MRTNILLSAQVFSLSGYGAHARDIALALLDDTRFNVSIIPLGWGASSTVDSLDEQTIQKLIFGVNNKLSSNLSSVFIHLGLPTEFERKGTYNIGMTAGLESTRIPQRWVVGCNKMDLIVVSTNFMKDAFLREGVTKPVLVVHEGVNEKVFNLETASEQYDLGTITSTTNFLTVGQCGNFILGKDRKQITLLVDTFVKAFDNDASVGLILKTYLHNVSSPDRYLMKNYLSKLIGRRKGPKIYLVHGEMTEVELASMYKDLRINAYVSMTSGEGWNRPTAEAMACGLPVIVTGWSGHMDYLNNDNAYLIDYKFQDIPQEVIQAGNWFEQGMKWAYPDADSAIAKMKYIKENSAVVKAKALEDASVFLKKYNRTDTYKVLTDTLAGVKLEDSVVVGEIAHKTY